MSLLDLFCPTLCEGCGRPGGPACTACRCALTGAPRPHRPTPCPAGLPPLWVMTAYDGPTRGLLLGFKERGVVELAKVLAEPLAQAVGSAGSRAPGRLLLVPAPSARAAIRTRGDDVMALLAARTARLLRAGGADCRAASVLNQRRVVADSAGLSAVMRADNMRGALGVRAGRGPLLAGVSVVIVDDLVTTGVTLCEADRALRAAGAIVVGAAAIAATQRWDSLRT